MSSPNPLYVLRRVQRIPLPLAMGAVLLGSVDGGLRTRSGAGAAERVSLATAEINIPRPSGAAGECGEHGGGGLLGGWMWRTQPRTVVIDERDCPEARAGLPTIR
jgi:hypothetical protein